MATVEETARRLARLLSGGGDALADAGRSDLVFEPRVDLRPLERTEPPPDTWAVDGGQALVADARCLKVYLTRAATVRWQAGACVLEDAGDVEVHLLGAGQDAVTAAGLRAEVARALAAGAGGATTPAPALAGAGADVNLLRDWAEWRAVAAAVEAAQPGALVLVDGDLRPDWRIPPAWMASLLDRAEARAVTVAGVTKHSSLSRGGAPLVGELERQAAAALGPRATWWAQVARTRPDPDAAGTAGGAGLAVVVARLDPDARFAFRVDLPAGAGPARALGALAAVSDDAAFPGYPYPLSVADRLAACPGWLRADVRADLVAGLDRAGVSPEVQERAFADRHRLMERSG
ncbi:MAG: DNA double-strand break repair nuclease NurA [Acidimicrobiales bacterium]